jgi:chemotaxis protein methyltransferase CheR
LNPIIQSHSNLDSLDELLRTITDEGDEQLHQQVIEALTINETSWFRDRHQYPLFNMLLQRMNKTEINVWSAACSTGQEPYSLMMSCYHLPQNIKILATDLSQATINKANDGIYSQFEMERGLNDTHKSQFFDKNTDGYQIKDDIKAAIRFEILNLLDDFSQYKNQDIIFCRNVLIYFDDSLKKDILSRLSQCLNPQGYLFLASTESQSCLAGVFQVKSENGVTFYQKI